MEENRNNETNHTTYTDEALVDFLLENKDTTTLFATQGCMNVFANLTIQHGWITEEQFNDAVEESRKNLAKAFLQGLDEEQRKNLEAKKTICEDELFGKYFKDLF